MVCASGVYGRTHLNSVTSTPGRTLYKYFLERGDICGRGPREIARAAPPLDRYAMQPIPMRMGYARIALL